MVLYADSSFLFSAFGFDEHTSQAVRWLASCSDFPIYVSRLTLFETENAYRAAAHDQRMATDHFSQALQRIVHAQRQGWLMRREVPAHQWFPQAHRISAYGSKQTASRALDILHVAAALILRADSFLSFDQRQCEAAEAEGLLVLP